MKNKAKQFVWNYSAFCICQVKNIQGKPCLLKLI